ncbi:MAG: hypothetical protein ACRYFA_09310 [Janthinobacterium lividum]
MSSTNKQIIGFGIVSAMRGSFGIGILSHYLNKTSSLALKQSKLGFIQSPVTAGLTKLLCAGEVVGDKLPAAADRIGFPQILGRIASGALCGAIVATNNKENLTKGIVLGGVCALAGSYAFFYLRKYAGGLLNTKDVYLGAAEDVLALGTGVALMK